MSSPNREENTNSLELVTSIQTRPRQQFIKKGNQTDCLLLWYLQAKALVSLLTIFFFFFSFWLPCGIWRSPARDQI